MQCGTLITLTDACLSQSLGHNVVAVTPRPRLPGAWQDPQEGMASDSGEPEISTQSRGAGNGLWPQIGKDNVKIGGGSSVAPSTNERWERPVPVASVFVSYVTNDECDPLLCSDSRSSVRG